MSVRLLAVSVVVALAAGAARAEKPAGGGRPAEVENLEPDLVTRHFHAGPPRPVVVRPDVIESSDRGPWCWPALLDVLLDRLTLQLGVVPGR